LKNLLSAVVRKLTKTKKPLLVVKLADTPEAVVIAQVRYTLKMARDWYAFHGRTILAVDCQNYLDAYEEASGFDRMEHGAVLLPVNKDTN